MSASRVKRTLGAASVAVLALWGFRTQAQSTMAPVNDAPNPYQTISNYFKLPAGRTWGSTSAVDIDKDGRTIWVAERCQANGCLDRATGQMSPLDPVLHFDANGNLIKSFGAGLIIFAHGIDVDPDGNIWVTDGQDNAPTPARGGGARAGGAAAGGGRAGGGAAGGRAAGAAPQGRQGPLPGSTKGHQVFKFSPNGEVLMTIGKPGGAAPPECCYQPNDVLVAPNGDIFVSEGHASTPGSVGMIFKFDKTGKLLKTWGSYGSGPGQFDQPHALALDSKGQLYVGDRNNNRVQVFDQNGTFIKEYAQWSRPSGIFIKDDVLYSADSESESVSRNHDGWKRGIRMGNLSDGKIFAFIPDPDVNATGTSAAEGVAVDNAGNIYGAEVGPRAVKKYVKR
jgi:sugar lactone lactonase YvrE